MNPNSTQDVDRHAARAALYSAAAGAFCYPDECTVRDLTHSDTEEGVRTAAKTLDLEEEADRLLHTLDAVTLEELESAYNDLFGLPGDDGTYPVIPYEVEYTVGDEVGRQQRRIATIVGLLEAFGIEPADEFDERQDHVVVELELMQVLAARRALACEEGDDQAAENLERAEAVVLSEHLTDFVPAFAHAVREAAAESDSSVYRAAADLAEALVTRDDAGRPDPNVDCGPEVKSHG